MALEQFDLDGQVAIVTGAGKGVGQGIARILAEASASQRLRWGPSPPTDCRAASI